MIVPCGYRVLVKPRKLEEVDKVVASAQKSGIYIPKEHSDIARLERAVDQAEVLALGPTAFKDYGDAWCEVGDIVAYAKYAGKLVYDPDLGEDVLVLNDEDVVCVIKESK